MRNRQRFVRKVCILKQNDFWDVSKWLAGAYKSSGSHVDHQQTPVLIRDDKIKWLDFGRTTDPENLHPHPGFVWVKSGYGEAIAWRKVQLTKQRNVDLTTDGLWAMPLNTGWGLPPFSRMNVRMVRQRHSRKAGMRNAPPGTKRSPVWIPMEEQHLFGDGRTHPFT